MKRFASPQALAGGAVRHPWLTVLLWLVLLGAAFYAAGSLGDVLTDDNSTGGSSDSARADRLIEQRLRADEPLREFVIIEVEGDAVPARFERAVADLTTELRAIPAVASAEDYRDNPDLLTADGRTAMIAVALDGASEDAVEIAQPLVDAVTRADAQDGLRVTTVGDGSINAEFEQLATETLEHGELIGMGVGLIILLVVFGAAVAAGLPLLLAIASIVLALGMTALVGQVFDLSTFVKNIVTMIGLAVGIDYSLFIVQRFREERMRGLPRDEAIRTAAATASRAVFVSGIAVVIALTGLLIMPDPTFRAFGIGAILVVIAAVAAALTLLPAVLRLLGDRVNWLTLPVIGRRRELESTGGFWGGTTRIVTAHPVVSVIGAGGLLLSASAFFFAIQLGSNGISSLPEDSDGRHAFEVVTTEFTDNDVVAAQIVVDAADVDAAPILDALTRLEALTSNDAFFGSASRETNEAGDLSLTSIAMLGDSSSREARDAVQRLREQYIPQAFAGVDATVLVTGGAAIDADIVSDTLFYMPIVFAAVLGASFLLLMVVFRSIVVPLKAVVMNLLSVGAAYGLVVLVFQKGVGAELLGFHQMPVVEAWLPLFLFSILFGLSMDYHIFLLSRIKERYDQTGDNRAAVEHGLRSTGAIITGAALIMVSVFGGFALGDLAMFQQMGFGLAVAVIIDATIVRSVLVPASMDLLGDWNWYYPKWLEWVPELHLEAAPAMAPVPAVVAGDSGGV